MFIWIVKVIGVFVSHKQLLYSCKMNIIRMNIRVFYQTLQIHN